MMPSGVWHKDYLDQRPMLKAGLAECGVLLRLMKGYGRAARGAIRTFALGIVAKS